VVQARLAAIRDDYIALKADAQIADERSREWGMTRRHVKRYIAVVRGRYARERTDADADFLRQLEGVVVANIQRARDTEQRAADAGEFRAECAAQAQQLRGVERLCAMRGLDAVRPQEAAAENPFHARARIIAELSARRSQPSIEATIAADAPATNGHANGHGTNGRVH